MGDRIAVMRKGVLQQIGTPEELYTRPANIFVATFIGSPAMNLLPASGDRYRRRRRTSPASGPSTSGSALRSRVARLRGGDRGRRVPRRRAARAPRLGDHSLVAKLPVEQQIEVGTMASFAVADESVVFFAADSGQATESRS